MNKKQKKKKRKQTAPPKKTVGSQMDGSKPEKVSVASPEKPESAANPASAVSQIAPPNTPPNNTSGGGDGRPPRQSKISRYVSFALLLGIIVLFTILFYEVMAKFLVPLFLAAILVVVFRPVHRWLLIKMGGREKSAALVTTIGVLLAVLIPIAALFAIAGAEGHAIFRQFNATKVTEGVKQIRTNLKLDMPSQVDLTLIGTELAKIQDEPVSDYGKNEEHRVLLFEIELYAKSLAEEQGLDWPEKPVEPDDDPSVENEENQQKADNNSENSDPASEVEPPKSAWEEFVSNLYLARDLHGKLAFPDDEDEAAKEKRVIQSHDYQLQVNKTAEDFEKFKIGLLGGKNKARWIELANPSNDRMSEYATQFVAILKDKLPSIGGAGIAYMGSLLVGIAIMIIAFYFFLLDGPKMIESFKGLSPIDDEHEQELVSEFSKVSRAVVVATLLSALVQGILAGIGFYFCGLESIILLTVLSAVLAMVPFVGAAAVWIPCALYLYFFDHNLPAAIGLAIYGVAVISMADNLIKPYILHGQSNLHPLFALLSVIGGVAALGPIGILIGPMIVAFLQTLLKILQREMTDMEKWAQDSSG